MFNKNDVTQIIYINMDDSGVLHYNEQYCIYGGIVFIGSEKRDNFIRKYKSSIKKIKCCYCQSDISKCKHKCPEIKDTNIRAKHKRWIFNIIKKNFTYALIISNQKVREYIMDNKKSRGRFRDYTQKRIIKEIVQELIIEKQINPYNPVKLIIRIDQQGTSTDTGRVFENDIYNELINGTYNYNYNLIYEPVLFSKLEIDLKYVLSHKHECIQASDIIAGETRKIMISNIDIAEKMKELSFLSVKLFLP